MRKRKGKEMQGEEEKIHDRLKKKLKATQITRKFTNPKHFPFFALFALSSPLLPPLSFLCRSNSQLPVDSSFCILIPPQRGTDNLGRGFLKLAPLTRYTARWVSYRNNFRAPFPSLLLSSPNRRAYTRETFFLFSTLSFFSYLTWSLLRRSVRWKLRCRLVKRFSIRCRLIAISVSNIWLKRTSMMVFYL